MIEDRLWLTTSEGIISQTQTCKNLGPQASWRSTRCQQRPDPTIATTIISEYLEFRYCPAQVQVPITTNPKAHRQTKSRKRGIRTFGCAWIWVSCFIIYLTSKALTLYLDILLFQFTGSWNLIGGATIQNWEIQTGDDQPSTKHQEMQRYSKPTKDVCEKRKILVFRNGKHQKKIGKHQFQAHNFFAQTSSIRPFWNEGNHYQLFYCCLISSSLIVVQSIVIQFPQWIKYSSLALSRSSGSVNVCLSVCLEGVSQVCLFKLSLSPLLA